jgi:hypothetical protein
MSREITIWSVYRYLYQALENIDKYEDETDSGDDAQGEGCKGQKAAAGQAGGENEFSAEIRTASQKYARGRAREGHSRAGDPLLCRTWFRRADA